MNPLLSIAEVATFTGLSEYTVRAAVREGDLPAVKIRRRIRISDADLMAWINAHRVAAHAPSPDATADTEVPRARRGELPTPDNVMSLIAARRRKVA
jgi:excisionase family DNA binding protein